jgi:hypoxanthine-guanine phosphoribosyltransferase
VPAGSERDWIRISSFQDVTKNSQANRIHQPLQSSFNN